jgi:hypothetical protein
MRISLDVIEHIMGLAFVGVVSGLFTSFIARRDFVSDRWWERKADTYTRILDALVELERIHETYSDDALHIRELNEAERAELERIWKPAWREVDSAIRLGAFVISHEAHAALAALRTATRGIDPQDFFGIVDAQFSATRECITQLREIGRKDLRLTRWWLTWSPFSRDKWSGNG